MNANRAILAGIIGIAAIGLLLLAMSGGDTGPEIGDLERARVDEVAVNTQIKKGEPRPRRTAREKNAKGPDGQEIEATLRELRTEGLPTRPPPGGPLDGNVWDERRQEADARWHESMMKSAETWADSRPMERDTAENVVNMIARFSKRVVSVREDARQGRVPREDARVTLEKLRMQIAEDSVRLLGEDEANELNSHLTKTTTGGGW